MVKAVHFFFQFANYSLFDVVWSYQNLMYALHFLHFILDSAHFNDGFLFLSNYRALKFFFLQLLESLPF